ncbi:hypothetical protein Nepgr_012571 [Nepenthes gracilis]|uniref:BP28 C-terminal domain-containing protein n=1 Tax=Nepenthes gracilis TaxID=150966 RepID=A0AAD3SG10_NEPGR|nr:hypothetical protein Nepgr_012571 [Nepenthes gracilis]
MPDSICRGKNALRFLISILDILLLKKDIQNRSSLIRPLFELLEKSFSNEWALALEHEEWMQHSLGVSETMSSTICYIQQTIFLILEDIVASLSTSDISPNDNILEKSSIVLLVKCAQSATDVTTRNHAFSLFATVSKVVPNKVLDLLPDVLAAISRSTITQNDSHSNRVFEDFITAIVPCWLSRTNSFVPLLQIFVNVMPDVALHRRLTIVLHLLRTIGEFSSLGSLFFLLFHSLVSRERLPSSDDEMHSSDLITSATQAEWEYLFAIQVCEQYTCMIWLPSLVMLLKQLEADNPDPGQFKQLQVAMKFIFEKLQDPEVLFKLESGEDSDIIQGTLGELMEKVVYHSQLVDSRRNRIALPTVIKKELKDLIHAVLTCITKGMILSTFFGSVIRLLGHANNGVQKKAVQLLCEAVKDFSAIKQKKVTESIMYANSSWQHLDESSLDVFGTLCLEILQLTDDSNDDLSLKLAAVAALEVLANRFPSDHAVFSMCLNSVTKSILSDDVSVASGCIRTAGALINVLGSRALPELPQIMENVLKKSRRVPSDSVTNTDNTSIRSTSKESVMLSTTVILEALIQKLGAFLNPYLQDLVELMVLHPDYVSGSSQKLKQNADAIRRLLTEKIPVRLALSPIQKVYTEAVISGDSSLSITFEMLTNFVGRMDRASVRSYHATLFDLCLRALDLRRQHLPSIKKINVVEKHVIDALIALTMKLTETMFKPLFIRCIEWAESNVEESDCIRGMNMDRAITFYGLVNKLAENHRSLFVPYFKYLCDVCVRHLTDGDVKNVDHFRKKKKAKMHNTEIKGREDSHALSLGKWQLRALVLSSLHKCFLYDTGSLKFLDSPNFQLLLQPIVSQLAVEPPASLEDFVDMPTVNEVNDLLVSCIGQMAVTSGSDLLWKPLNYEVLMQTRSEMVRSRILGLRIVKYLVENLKEEYLVLLAETLPFLVELLEDVELPVKTLAQEILKELESMSGESLRQYF